MEETINHNSRAILSPNPRESRSIQAQPNPVGRPTVITEDVVRQLEVAFQNGMSDKTACQHAQISRTAFYERINTDPAFVNRMQRAKNFLKLLAGKRLVHIIKDGADRDAAGLVKFALERLEPEQFGDKSDVVINQNFAYQPPNWFTAPQDLATAPVQDVNVSTYESIQADDVAMGSG